MNCLVIDDEPLARELLESYISSVDGLRLVGSCPHAMEAFSILRRQSVDVIFLDIHMPLVNGIELLRSLSQKPQVIFTTAYRDYAFEAYDLDVVDYLLKPVRFDRFLRSLAKLDQKNAETTPASDAASGNAYLFLRVEGEMVKIYLRDIIVIESLRDYVRVRTNAKDFLSYQKISTLEHRLPEENFVRIHRSFIVGLQHVTSFNSRSVTVSTIQVPIGRNFKAMALKVLNQNNLMKS